jgi:hypothetical protein
MCTSNPKLLQCSLMSSNPLIRSDLKLKMKAPPSIYRILRSLKVEPEELSLVAG